MNLNAFWQGISLRLATVLTIACQTVVSFLFWSYLPNSDAIWICNFIYANDSVLTPFIPITFCGLKKKKKTTGGAWRFRKAEMTNGCGPMSFQRHGRQPCLSVLSPDMLVNVLWVIAVCMAPRQMCGFPVTDDGELEVDVTRLDFTASSQGGSSEWSATSWTHAEFFLICVSFLISFCLAHEPVVGLNQHCGVTN